MGRSHMAVGCLILAAGVVSAAPALRDERSVRTGSQDDGDRHDGSANEQAVSRTQHGLDQHTVGVGQLLNQQSANLNLSHHGGKQNPNGDDVEDETQPNVASSKALQDAHAAHTTTRGGAAEVFIFLAGGVFGGILIFMVATIIGKYESIKVMDEFVDKVGDEEMGSSAGKPSPTVRGKHESWREKDRGVPDKNFAISDDVPLELPLDGTNLGPVVLSEVPSASGSSTTATVQKHESWRRRDRPGAVTSGEDPFNFGVAGNLVPVENRDRKGGLPHHPNSFSLM